MKVKVKFLKSRRDRTKGSEIDTTVNLASAKAINRKPVSGAFGGSNFGRNISPDAGKSGGSRLGGKSINPVGGGKGRGMGNPTMSGAAANPAKTGTAQDVIPFRKGKKSKTKFLKSRG